MESRSWLPVAASHGGLLRGKGTQGGVTTPKMGRRGAWWWHWVSEHHIGVLQGRGEGTGAGGPHSICSSRVIPGFGAFLKGHGDPGAGACHQKGPHPREHGRTWPGAFPAPSTVPTAFSKPTPSCFTVSPWDLVQGWLCPLCHLGVPTPHSAAPGRAKPVWETHPEPENPLGPMAGICHRSSGGTRQEAAPMSPSPGLTRGSRRGRR